MGIYFLKGGNAILAPSVGVDCLGQIYLITFLSTQVEICDDSVCLRSLGLPNCLKVFLK